MNFMGNFNRGRSGGRRSFVRRGFSDRGPRGSVQMYRATCDNCRKDCEVPFRPTNGKPVFCSNCFGNNRGSERPANFDERQMFGAVCADCGNNCKVPFQPSGGKPVYCSNCFGDKKDGKSRSQEQFQYHQQFEQLNIKLDKILTMLDPNNFAPAVMEETIGTADQAEEQTVDLEETPKATKKRSTKKS